MKNDDGVFLFKFSSKSGMEQVLERGPRMILWGRFGFSWALIEVSSDSDLKKEVIMAILNKKGNWYIKEITRVEYKWKPPHCVECKSFGHSPITCPNHVNEVVPKVSSMVTNKPSHMED
ncbi:hypothetical protein Tco_0693353 [Tanacetum coccineum]